MKILALVVGLMMWTPSTVDARCDQSAEKTAAVVCTLKVSGMTCAGCEAAVRIAARRVDGVTDVKVSHAKGSAEVTYEPAKTSPQAIAKAISDKSGFKAEVTEPAPQK